MAFTEEQRKRYSRQLVLKEMGPGGQEKLAAGRVLVIGAGGLGSAALLYLAAAGVGTLGIADYDAVDLSNLARQILHPSSRQGAAKAESAEKTIAAINPDVRVLPLRLRITPENILETIRDYDAVLDCTDRFETKLLINDACVIAGKPFVHAGVLRFSGQIMTWRPGPWPCLRCLTGDAPAAREGETCAVSGVMGAAVGVIGCMQALEAIKLLLGKGELLTGRILHFDGLSMTFSETAVSEKSPYCKVCGAHPEIRDPAADPSRYAPPCG